MEKETLAVIGSMAAAILVLAQIIRQTFANRRIANREKDNNPRRELQAIKDAVETLNADLGAKIEALGAKVEAVGRRVEDIWERGRG